jgi:hypothetical protein
MFVLGLYIMCLMFYVTSYTSIGIWKIHHANHKSNKFNLFSRVRCLPAEKSVEITVYSIISGKKELLLSVQFFTNILAANLASYNVKLPSIYQLT